MYLYLDRDVARAQAPRVPVAAPSSASPRDGSLRGTELTAGLLAALEKRPAHDEPTRSSRTRSAPRYSRSGEDLGPDREDPRSAPPGKVAEVLGDQRGDPRLSLLLPPSRGLDSCSRSGGVPPPSHPKASVQADHVILGQRTPSPFAYGSGGPRGPSPPRGPPLPRLPHRAEPRCMGVEPSQVPLASELRSARLAGAPTKCLDRSRADESPSNVDPLILQGDHMCGEPTGGTKCGRSARATVGRYLSILPGVSRPLRPSLERGAPLLETPTRSSNYRTQPSFAIPSFVKSIYSAVRVVRGAGAPTRQESDPCGCGCTSSDACS